MSTQPDITHHNLTLCPNCGYTLTAAGTVDGLAGRAVAGDVVGCMACGQPLVYLMGMDVRKLTQDEYDALPGDMKADLGKIRAFAQTGWYKRAHQNDRRD